MTRKRSLPIAGKSLMPEILPDPKHAAAALRVSPRARVRARLRQLSDNAALLAAASNLVACGSEAHEPAAPGANGGSAGLGTGGQNVAGRAGVGAVAGKSGTGGTGGVPGKPGVTAGYGVVDPLPSPAQVCAMLSISSASAEWKDAQTAVLSVQLSRPLYGQAVLTAVMATSGVTASITGTAQPYTVTLKTQTWPKSTQLTLAFTCTGSTVTGTFMTTVVLDTSNPSMIGPIKVITGRDVDAGSDAGSSDAGI